MPVGVIVGGVPVAVTLGEAAVLLGVGVTLSECVGVAVGDPGA